MYITQVLSNSPGKSNEGELGYKFLDGCLIYKLGGDKHTFIKDTAKSVTANHFPLKIISTLKRIKLVNCAG